MNFNFKKMKAILFTITFFSVTLFHSILSAQVIKPDSAFWDNNAVSLISQLGPVWVILKKGNDLKDVRIHEIKKEKGVLVYEKDKCLHDIYINNIKKIEPGKYPLQSMFFYPDNTPYIKEIYQRIDGVVNYSSFKSIAMPEPVKQVKPAVTAVAEMQEFIPSSTVCDTIIDVSGNITLAKIINITPRLISYKKIANPNGPIYIKSNNNTTITRYADCVAVKFSEKY